MKRRKMTKVSPQDIFTFSKQVLVATTAQFMAVILFQSVMWAVANRVSVELITASTTAFTSGLGFYAFKAGFENVNKIKQSDVFGNPENMDVCAEQEGKV